MIMKGLLDLVIPTDVVKVSGGEFSVRGLSPDDGLQLYYRHASDLSALFDQFAGKLRGDAEVEPSEVLEAGSAMVSGAPQLMAEIIALANGASVAEDDSFNMVVAFAKQLPAGVQVDALQKIAALTFSSDMPPGKFVGLVLAMVRSTTAAISAQTT